MFRFSISCIDSARFGTTQMLCQEESAFVFKPFYVFSLFWFLIIMSNKLISRRPKIKTTDNLNNVKDFRKITHQLRKIALYFSKSWTLNFNGAIARIRHSRNISSTRWTFALWESLVNKVLNIFWWQFVTDLFERAAKKKWHCENWCCQQKGHCQ